MTHTRLTLLALTAALVCGLPAVAHAKGAEQDAPWGTCRPGKLERSVEAAQSALQVAEKKAGLEMAASLDDLAILHFLQGDYDKAKWLYTREQTVLKTELGPDDPRVSASYSLAFDAGRASEKAKAQGPDSMEVAETLTKAGQLYHFRGGCAKAEALYQRALGIMAQARGPEHSDVANIMANLAILYGAQKRHAEAERLFLRALAISEKSLGPDHPTVAAMLGSLAMLYRTTGRVSKAEALDRRVEKIVANLTSRP